MSEPTKTSNPLGPLSSEAAMFRVVVVVGLAALPIIVVGLLAGPLWGALVLVGELVGATVVAVRRWRLRSAASPPPAGEVPAATPGSEGG